jgi:hypothetical protein
MRLYEQSSRDLLRNKLGLIAEIQREFERNYTADSIPEDILLAPSQLLPPSYASIIGNTDQWAADDESDSLLAELDKKYQEEMQQRSPDGNAMSPSSSRQYDSPGRRSLYSSITQQNSNRLESKDDEDDSGQDDASFETPVSNRSVSPVESKDDGGSENEGRDYDGGAEFDRYNAVIGENYRIRQKKSSQMKLQSQVEFRSPAIPQRAVSISNSVVPPPPPSLPPSTPIPAAISKAWSAVLTVLGASPEPVSLQEETYEDNFGIAATPNSKKIQLVASSNRFQRSAEYDESLISDVIDAGKFSSRAQLRL